MVTRYILLSVLSVALAGCSGEDADPNIVPPVPVRLTLWNRSQFELLDVRAHEAPGYAGSANLLIEPLAIEARLDLDVLRGDRITVIRRKVEVGDTIALTTGRALTDIGDGSTLVVFDEAFRLLPATAP